MSDYDSYEEDLTVPETEEPLVGLIVPNKGPPVTIQTNEDVWIVLGSRKSFEVQRLLVESEPTTIEPNQGKVGIVIHTIGEQLGQREFTVKQYKVEPNSNLKVRAEEKEVIRLGVKEKRVQFSLYCDQKEDHENPEKAVQKTYNERRCKTGAEIAKMVVGITAGVVATAVTAAVLV